MEFEFNHRNYQTNAIESVIDLFEGQPEQKQKLDNSFSTAPLNYGNKLEITNDKLLENLHTVQKKNNRDDAPLELTETLDNLDFSIEMETGTGKTYVYLKTIVELAKIYGWKKYIIVVPSVAIREGVKTEFDRIKSRIEADSRLSVSLTVYDSSRLNELETYYNSNMVEIMLITMQSFNSDGNILYKDTADLTVRQPIKWIQNVNPIVILDEPQNIGEATKEKLNEFNPLFVLRYSATHKELINPIYRYTPIDAYRDNYVKKIEVLSVFGNDIKNVNSYVEVLKIDNDKSGIFAQVNLYRYDKGTVKVTSRKLRHGRDLYEISGGMPEYEGYKINEINLKNKYMKFDNSVIVKENQVAQDKDELMRIQIHETIRTHLIKEKELNNQGIKVLSLFFIDKVDNYRDYSDDNSQGKIKRWFEEEYHSITKETEFKEYAIDNLRNVQSIDDIQGAYFARDKDTQHYKDSTNRDTKADAATYDLIMKNKELLLSFDNPVRFIFSHSALREGWDNPNVFQICTLNETISELKKRQEIGRGLRLPIDQSGNRIQDEYINILTVVANQSYEIFAKGLQEEIAEDTGIETTKNKVPVEDARKRKRVTINEQALLNPEFNRLWEKISKKTNFTIEINDDELIDKIVKRLEKENFKIEQKVYNITRTQIIDYVDASETGVVHEVKTKKTESDNRVPNIIKRVADNTGVTKKNIIAIIHKARISKYIFVDPDKFVEKLTAIINIELPLLLKNGIKYVETGENYDVTQFKKRIDIFEDSELTSPVLIHEKEDPRTLYKNIQLDSANEVQLVNQFKMDPSRFKFYFKLPEWFKVKTPAGNYNPDWGIVFQEDEKEKLYLVRESKWTNKPVFLSDYLRSEEDLKIQYGKKHFDAIGVDYQVIEEVNDVKSGIYSFTEENSSISEEKVSFIENLKTVKKFGISYEQAYNSQEEEFDKFNILKEDYENL